MSPSSDKLRRIRTEEQSALRATKDVESVLLHTSSASGSTLLLHSWQIDELAAEGLPVAGRPRAVRSGLRMFTDPTDDIGRSRTDLVVNPRQVHAKDPGDRQVDRAEEDDREDQRDKAARHGMADGVRAEHEEQVARAQHERRAPEKKRQMERCAREVEERARQHRNALPEPVVRVATLSRSGSVGHDRLAEANPRCKTSVEPPPLRHSSDRVQGFAVE